MNSFPFFLLAQKKKEFRHWNEKKRLFVLCVFAISHKHIAYTHTKFFFSFFFYRKSFFSIILMVIFRNLFFLFTNWNTKRNHFFHIDILEWILVGFFSDLIFKNYWSTHSVIRFFIFIFIFHSRLAATFFIGVVVDLVSIHILCVCVYLNLSDTGLDHPLSLSSS